ncbi:MAG: hypothetical protein ABL903_03275 [Methylococcales bacterium]
MNIKLVGLISLMISFGAVYWFFQPVIQFSNGHPWDAEVYYAMAQQAAAQTSLSGAKPFIYRFGTSMLVGKLFPANIMLGFSIINGLFGIGIVVSSAIILSRYLKSYWVVALLLGLLIMNPNGPARFLGFFPVFTDASALFFITAIFAIGGSGKTGMLVKTGLLLLTTLGVFFREIVLIAPLSLLMENSYWRYFKKHDDQNELTYCLLCSVFLGLLGIAATHLMVEATGDYTAFSHALFSLSRHIKHPDIFLLAFFTTYGPVFLILVLNARYTIKRLSLYPHLFIYTLLVFIIAIVGGTHTDRFLFWAFPSVLLGLGLVMENAFKQTRLDLSGCLFWSVLVLSQLLAFRAFTVLPDALIDVLKDTEHSRLPGLVLFAPYGDCASIEQIYSTYMGVEQRIIVLLEYIVLGVFLHLTMPRIISVDNA